MSDPLPAQFMRAGGIPRDAVQISLTGQQTLQGAAALKQNLLQALAAQADIAIDLAKVETIDTAALQLIMSATVSANAAGRGVTVMCPAGAPAAKQMLALGFSNFIDLSTTGGATGQTIQEGYRA